MRLDTLARSRAHGSKNFARCTRYYTILWRTCHVPMHTGKRQSERAHSEGTQPHVVSRAFAICNFTYWKWKSGHSRSFQRLENSRAICLDAVLAHAWSLPWLLNKKYTDWYAGSHVSKFERDLNLVIITLVRMFTERVSRCILSLSLFPPEITAWSRD